MYNFPPPKKKKLSCWLRHCSWLVLFRIDSDIFVSCKDKTKNKPIEVTCPGSDNNYIIKTVHQDKETFMSNII